MDERPRALVFDFALVKGPLEEAGPDERARATAAWVVKLEPDFEVDVLTLKTDDVPHVERFGKGRMLRVPCPGEESAAREAFRRAVRRQLQDDDYALVVARSPWAAEGLAGAASSFRLVLDGN